MTEQAFANAGAVLSSGRCGIGFLLLRTSTCLFKRNSKEKDVKNKACFILNVQGSFRWGSVRLPFEQDSFAGRRTQLFFICVIELLVSCCYSYHHVKSCNGHQRQKTFVWSREELTSSRKREMVLDKFNELDKCPWREGTFDFLHLKFTWMM